MSATFTCDVPTCDTEFKTRPTEPVVNFTFPLDGGLNARVSITVNSDENGHWPDLCPSHREQLINEARAFVARREAA